MRQPTRKTAVLIAIPAVLVIAQVAFVAAIPEATPQQAQPQSQEMRCPGEQMGVQATGEYLNRPVPEFVVNGQPWGGAYWQAGMRSYWHCHTGGQLLIVWEGEGRTQKRGERVTTLRKGESSWAGPGEEHWHGSSPHAAAQFLQGSPTPSTTLWMEEVSDTDYLGNGIGMETRAEFLRTGVREQRR